MSIAEKTRKFISKQEYGQIFVYDDIPIANRNAVAIELTRLAKSGKVKKVSKGKFYKPKQRTFGEIGPSSSDKIEHIVKSSFKYETGNNIYRKLGLTTQVSKTIVIAHNSYYRRIQLDNINIKLVPTRVEVPLDDVYLLQILDAIKDLKIIPSTSPSEAYGNIKTIISELDKDNKFKLLDYVYYYPPFVKAILGSILSQMGMKKDTKDLKSSLNYLSKYKLNIADELIPNKKDWNIQ